MGTLQDRINSARKERDWRACKGLFFGFIIAAIFTRDLLLSILISAGIGLIVGIASSREVDRLKQIQNLRR